VSSLELGTWKIEYKKGWDRHFYKFDKPIREQILKKLEQMKQPLGHEVCTRPDTELRKLANTALHSYKMRGLEQNTSTSSATTSNMKNGIGSNSRVILIRIRQISKEKSN